MLIVAAALFAVAALGGLTMAYIHFGKQRNPPFALAVLHGVFAATALIILLWTVLRMPSGTLVAWALGLFVVAALAGFFLFSYHIRGKSLPGPGVVVHAAVAVTAFVLLLVGIVAA
jgi:hypothetical protein